MLASFLRQPGIAYLSPNDRNPWRASGYAGKTAKLGGKLAFLRLMVKAMADAGVELIAGTDAPAVPGLLPGMSLHDDLAELERSGLSRFQTLSTATRTPGDFIRRTKGRTAFGEVTTGYRADLILSEANPLDDLATLRRPLGVMVGGHWRNEAELGRLREQVRSSYDVES